MKVDMSSTQISLYTGTDARSHEKIKLSGLVKLSFSVVAKMNNGYSFFKSVVSILHALNFLINNIKVYDFIKEL